MPRLKVVMLGLMGSGKTFVGKELAERLDLPYSDSDQTIADEFGMTAREIQEASAVPHLHALEVRHLLDALRSPAPTVVSAAASVVDTGLCRAALRAANVFGIWLRARPETLVARFSKQEHRPSYGDPAEFFRAQITVRSAHFHEVSVVTIDVDDLAVTEVVAVAEASVRSHLTETSDLRVDEIPLDLT